jgi:hypothetical protein
MAMGGDSLDCIKRGGRFKEGKQSGLMEGMKVGLQCRLIEGLKEAGAQQTRGNGRRRGGWKRSREEEGLGWRKGKGLMGRPRLSTGE